MSLDASIKLLFNAKQAQETLDKMDKKLSRFGRNVGRVFKFATGVGITSAIVNGAKVIYRELDAMDNLSRSFNLPLEQINRFQNALSSFGGDSEEANKVLNSLENAINQYRLFASGPLIEVGSKIGISLRKANGELKDSIDIVSDLREEFKTLDAGQRTAILQMLGLDIGSFRRLIDAPDDAFTEAMSKKTTQNIENSIDTVREFETAFSEATQELKNIVIGLTADIFTPVLKHEVGVLKRAQQSSGSVWKDVFLGLYDVADAFGMTALVDVVQDGFEWSANKILDGLEAFDEWGYELLDELTGKEEKEQPNFTPLPSEMQMSYPEDMPEWTSLSDVPLFSPMPEENNFTPFPFEENGMMTPFPSQEANMTPFPESTTNNIRNTFNFNMSFANKTDEEDFLRNMQTVIRNSTTGVYQ